MNLPPPEFSRIVRLDELGRAAKPVTISATPEECAALAARFALLSLDRLEAEYTLVAEGAGIVARGQIRAGLSQACVATGQAVPETLDSPFAVRFEREPDHGAPEEEEIALEEEDCDTIFYTGESIDVGEAVAQTLYLSLTPYPRAANADAYLKKMGVISEEQASPFAMLLSLANKDKDKAGR